MKTTFLIVKKKTIITVLLCAIAICTFCGAYFPIKASATPKAVHTIVIDAGHGGKDGGAVGKKTQVTESWLNLQYTMTLKNVAEQFGYRVVLTREDMNGLYSPLATNKKRSEMEKREKIIKKANPDVVVSVHMNSFPSSAAHGSQVYYASGNQAGQMLADSVSGSLHKNIKNAKLTSKVGDFYVLNCTQSPAILVECGFLSNPEEEMLLQEQEYMQKFCYHLFCGILSFFSFE